MNQQSRAGQTDPALDRLTYLRAEVKSPVDDPEDIADVGDDDGPALTITDIRI